MWALFESSWETDLLLIKFAYNNNYHSSIGMAPFEALYRRPCRSPLCWAEVGDDKLLELELVQEINEKINIVKEKMKAAQNRQKSYADKHRKDLEFSIGDHVLLKVSLVKGVVRFGQKRGNRSPVYIGPFKILEPVGRVAYRLALPPKMSGMHNVFHISMLRRIVHDLSHKINFKDIEVNDNVTYNEGPVKILERGVKKLRTKEIPIVKVQ